MSANVDGPDVMNALQIAPESGVEEQQRQAPDQDPGERHGLFPHRRLYPDHPEQRDCGENNRREDRSRAMSQHQAGSQRTAGVGPVPAP